ncbi:MAG: hypothetical protein IPQ13_09590 [Holophagaceae bacterium]|nr:hypothetical protein [Holophagaceae bacterium]
MASELNHPEDAPEAGLPQAPEPEPEEPEVLEVHPTDSFHRIIFGQVEEPLFPAPSTPSETPEDDLTRAALNDPAASTVDIHDTGPTLWRFVVLVVLVVAALAIVFWKR